MVHRNEIAEQSSPGSLDLALLALSEIANRQPSKTLTFEKKDIQEFCDAVISRNDEAQIELIEALITRGISLELLYEIFIPQAAERLGDLWKKNKVTFVDVNIGTQRLQRLSRIYEKQYLGPMYLFSEGPEILLILPRNEVHTLSLITASGIFKKNGANPFVAVGYSNEEIVKLISENNFKLIGISVSNTGNISDCVETANYIRTCIPDKIPMVIGGQGIAVVKNPELYAVFDEITIDPLEALELISDKEYN